MCRKKQAYHDSQKWNLANMYLFKFNKKISRKRCGICSKFRWRHQNNINGVFLLSLLLNLNMYRTNIFHIFAASIHYKEMLIIKRENSTQNSRENTFVSHKILFNKIASLRAVTFLKNRNSDTAFFLWNLRNF